MKWFQQYDCFVTFNSLYFGPIDWKKKLKENGIFKEGL